MESTAVQISLRDNLVTVTQLSDEICTLQSCIRDVSKAQTGVLTTIRRIADLLTPLNDAVVESRDEVQWSKIYSPLVVPVGHLAKTLGSLAEYLRNNRNQGQELYQSSRSRQGVRSNNWYSSDWEYTRLDVLSKLSVVQTARKLLAHSKEQERSRMAQTVLENTRKNRQRLQALSPTLERSQARDDIYKELLEWLSPLDFEIVQQDVSSRRDQETSLGFLESPGFQRWIEGSPTTLWCPGLPGCGKTTRTSLVVDHLANIQKSNDKVGIAYVYCSYQDQDQQTAVNLVGAMLRQLLVERIEKDGDMLPEVLSIYQRHSPGQTRPLLGDLADLLKKQLAVHERVYLIIDALDECSKGNGTRGTIIDLLKTLRDISKRCSLFVTSRKAPYLEDELGINGCLRLDVRWETADLWNFVCSDIRKYWRTAKELERDSSLKNEIVGDLVENTNGVLLQVALQCSLLSTCTSSRQLRSLLDRPLTSLHDIYNKFINNIDLQHHQDRGIAYEILYWVAHAKRPLTTAELQCALSLKMKGSKPYSRKSILENDMFNDRDSLITVERATGIVGLVHYSAKEYLLSASHLFTADYPRCVALKCLMCLSLEDCRRGPCASDSDLESRLQRIPLLGYAAKYWSDHVKDCRDLEPLERALKLLQDKRLLGTTWQIMHIPSVRYPNYSQTYPQWASGLQLAALFDLKELVPRLVDCGMDIENQDDFYGRPLHAAAANGSLDVCRLLVQKGVDVNARGGRLDSALQAAASAGHDKVVDLLLKAKADPNAQGGLYTTSLQAASLHGHFLIAQLLLQRGATVDTQILSGRTALHCAAMHGHLRIVDLLLQRGANVNARDNDTGRTALSWAVWYGHRDTVHFLFAWNADIDAVDHQNSTALHLALERHHEAIVQDLLAKGAKFDVIDTSDKTQLDIALASIEKINTGEFEIHDKLTKGLDQGSQANVSVLRRMPKYQLHKAQFELVLRKSFKLDDPSAEDIRRNLMRERQALQNPNHPNVVKYVKYEQDKKGDQAFLYTEYCDGGSLLKYCRGKSQSLDFYTTWSIIHDLAAALAYCHHGLHLDEGGSFSLKHKWQTLLHRDIKPANIVLSNTGKVGRGAPVAKLCDMGWAKIWSDPKGRHTAQVGTLCYMPKEVREGGAWTPKGDIYSLGATLRDLNQDFKDAQFKRLISECTEEKPSSRPSSFTLLEIAAKRLSDITGQNLKDRFLQRSYRDSAYLFQAVLESLNHLFISYLALNNLPMAEAAKRLRLLIADWDKGEADVLQSLGLDTSPQFALIFGDVEKATTLIKSGHKGFSSIWSSRGFTPLHIACRENYQDVVRCWLERNLFVDDQDGKGRSALHWAVIVGSLALCQKLLQAGASTDLRDVEGSAALHRAAESGHLEIIGALLIKKANIEATNQENATPLHTAAASGHKKAVDLLLGRGANPSAIDMYEFSPAGRALVNGFQALGQYLRKVSRSRKGHRTA